jgi:hypothetical protein
MRILGIFLITYGVISTLVFGIIGGEIWRGYMFVASAMFQAGIIVVGAVLCQKD